MTYGRLVFYTVLFAVVIMLAFVMSAKAATIAGTSHADYLSGTPSADKMFGYGGDDTLKGRAGNDRLVGGPDDDYLVGNAGRDTIEGGYGNDTIQAQDNDADVLWCGNGQDTAQIDLGLDELHGCEFVGGVGP